MISQILRDLAGFYLGQNFYAFQQAEPIPPGSASLCGMNIIPQRPDRKARTSAQKNGTFFASGSMFSGPRSKSSGFGLRCEVI